MNCCDNSAQVVIDPAGYDKNQVRDLCRNEKGKSLKRIASSEMPVILKVAKTSKKAAICRPGSSCSSPPNCTEFCIILTELDLISKWSAKIAGRTILGANPSPPRRPLSLSGMSS